MIRFNFFKKEKKINPKTKLAIGAFAIIMVTLLVMQKTKNEDRVQININGNTIYAEKAATPRQRYQGLMYRNDLENNEGMLFYFDFEGNHSFWMKNTFMALDMIWADDSKTIVHIEHSAPPCTTENCITYQSPKPARYVLELRGGWAINNGLQIGDKLEF